MSFILLQPIVREPKVFRPLAIPRALQKELPYRDKPKHKKEAGPSIDGQRVAVVREARERKVNIRFRFKKKNQFYCNF